MRRIAAYAAFIGLIRCFHTACICGAITLTAWLATSNLVSQSVAVNQERGRGLGKPLR